MNEKIKNEILKRYEILFEQGMYEPIKESIKDEQTWISMNFWGAGLVTSPDQVPEYIPYIDKIESERNVNVYMGLVCFFESGTLLALMFVADTESEWEAERSLLKNEKTHRAFVFHIEEETCEECMIRYEMKINGPVMVDEDRWTRSEE